MKNKPPKIAAIEKEFDEPFVEVVRGFAEMGYSRKSVAEILEFNLSYLRLLIKRHDLGHHFLPQCKMRREFRKTAGGGGWPKGKPRNTTPKHSDEEILYQVRRFSNSSVFMTMADIHITTVQRRFGSFRAARDIAFKQSRAA